MTAKQVAQNFSFNSFNFRVWDLQRKRMSWVSELKYNASGVCEVTALDSSTYLFYSLPSFAKESHDALAHG